MSLRNQAAKGSLTLAMGEGVGYGSSFVRNMILARVLAKADFGIAATFSLVMTLLEFSAKLGISRFVVRDKEGNDSEFIEAAHGMQAATALFSAGLIALASPLLARLFGIPEQAWAFTSLAALAALRGFEHLDVRRFERELRFGPSVLVDAVPQVVITLAAWPVAHWLGDFRAVLVLLFAKSLASCTMSHLMAERPYRWRWHREYDLRMLRFGWPLLVTGFLMFGVMQGDQFLVATFYSLEDLAPYAAAAALVMAPAFMFGRIFNSVALPLLARVQDDSGALERRYRQVVSGVTVFSVMSSVGLIMGAEVIMRLAYGQKYAGAGVFLGWLAAANAFRTLRMAPALAALAKGDSQNQMISNLARVMSLIPAVLVAWMHQPVWMLACMGLFGEALACSVSFTRLRRRDGIPLAASLKPAVLLAVVVGASGLASWLGVGHWPGFWALPAAAAGALAAGVIAVGILAEARSEVRRFVGSVCAHEFFGSAKPRQPPSGGQN